MNNQQTYFNMGPRGTNISFLSFDTNLDGAIIVDLAHKIVGLFSIFLTVGYILHFGFGWDVELPVKI